MFDFLENKKNNNSYLVRLFVKRSKYGMDKKNGFCDRSLETKIGVYIFMK